MCSFRLLCTVCSEFSVQFVQSSLYSLFRLLCTVCSEFSVQFVQTSLSQDNLPYML